MEKLYKRLEGNYLLVKPINVPKIKDIGGGFKIDSSSTPSPYKTVEVVQVAESLKTLYNVGDTLLIRASKADYTDYLREDLSWIKGGENGDVMAVV